MKRKVHNQFLGLHERRFSINLPSNKYNKFICDQTIELFNNNKQKQKFKQLTVLLFLYGREHKIYARYKNLKSAYFTLSAHFHLLIGTFYSLFHILYTNKIEDFPIWNFANVLNCYYRYEIIFPPSSVEKIICESYV